MKEINETRTRLLKENEEDIFKPLRENATKKANLFEELETLDPLGDKYTAILKEIDELKKAFNLLNNAYP